MLIGTALEWDTNQLLCTIKENGQPDKCGFGCGTPDLDKSFYLPAVQDLDGDLCEDGCRAPCFGPTCIVEGPTGNETAITVNGAVYEGVDRTQVRSEEGLGEWGLSLQNFTSSECEDMPLFPPPPPFFSCFPRSLRLSTPFPNSLLPASELTMDLHCRDSAGARTPVRSRAKIGVTLCFRRTRTARMCRRLSGR